MGLMLVVLLAALAVIVLGVTVAALRNGISAPEDQAVDELTARIAQQRRHSSHVQSGQRTH